MKVKSLLALTAALSFGVVAAQAATPATPATPAAQAPNLTDVPAGHWAKDAIDRLVSQGIILGYPDGTYRGTQNLTRYEAAVIIARLLDQIGSGTGPALGSEDLTALQNAVQELAADLAALGVRVSDLEDNAVSKDDFARLEDRLTTLEAANGDPEALAQLTTTIDDLNTKVDDLQANYDTLRADVDDNASSIAALNDLTVLLNQDILNLQDRVSALEAGQIDRADFDALSTKVSGIDSRVAVIEGAPKVILSGGITSTNGNISLTSGTTNFDIDRLTTGTFFGASLSNDDVTSVDTKPQDAVANGTDLSFGLSVQNLKTANGSLLINDATLSFGVNNLFSVAGDTTVRLKTAFANGTLAGSPFKVFYNADYSKFKLNEYAFDNDASENTLRRGVVATFTATGLPLSPALTLIAGNGTVGSSRDNASAGSQTFPATFPTGAPAAAPYFGVRASINPLGIGDLGLSYATGTAVDGARDLFSADYNFNLAGVKLDGVYTGSGNRTQGRGVFSGNTAFYTRATASLLGVNIAANFRAIDPLYYNGVASLSSDGQADGNNSGPFAAYTQKLTDTAGTTNGTTLTDFAVGQYGYGFGASANVSIISVGAYYDFRTNYTGGDPANTGTNFGVSAGLNNIFAGFGLRAFYNSARDINGNTVDAASFGANAYDAYTASYSPTATYQGSVQAPYRFTSTFGAVLTHDGKAANALVPNLNLAFGYANFYDSGANDFAAYGDYSTTLGGVTIKPFARYHANSGGVVSDPVNATQTINSLGYSTFKVGAQVSTAPLGIFFAPSLDGGAVYRSSNFSNGTNVSEQFYRVGLTFNEFFAKDVTFGVGYSYYTGSNVNSVTIASGNDAFRADRDRIYRSYPSNVPFQAATGSASGSVSGIYTQLNLYGVKASYGIFNYVDAANAANNSTGQGFKLGYEVKF